MMEKDITFAYSKSRWSVIANLAITLCVFFWISNTNVPTDYSAENAIIRSISPWIVAAATSIAALCNFLWLKKKDFAFY